MRLCFLLTNEIALNCSNELPMLILFAEDVDYTDTYRTDGFDNSDMDECVSVPILSDSLDEEEECFTVSLSATTYLAGLTLNPSIGTVCIIDDDGR